MGVGSNQGGAKSILNLLFDTLLKPANGHEPKRLLAAEPPASAMPQ